MVFKVQWNNGIENALYTPIIAKNRRSAQQKAYIRVFLKSSVLKFYRVTDSDITIPLFDSKLDMRTLRDECKAILRETAKKKQQKLQNS